MKLTGIIRRSKRKPIVIGYGIVFNGLEEVQGNNLDLSFLPEVRDNSVCIYKYISFLYEAGKR